MYDPRVTPLVTPDQIAMAAHDLARSNAGLGLILFLNWETVRDVVSALVLQVDLVGEPRDDVTELITGLKAKLTELEES